MFLSIYPMVRSCFQLVEPVLRSRGNGVHTLMMEDHSGERDPAVLLDPPWALTDWGCSCFCCFITVRAADLVIPTLMPVPPAALVC